MQIQKVITGPLEVNCYLIEDSSEAIVVDPGGEEIEPVLRTLESEVVYLVNTHGHLDHVAANHTVSRITGAPLLIHSKDADQLKNAANPLLSPYFPDYQPVTPDKLVEEGDEIKVGNLVLKVIHTPGHTLGGISLLAEEFILTGDTLFAGGIGRTDLGGGDYQTLIDSIRQKLFCLDENLEVLPGHGPSSTIGREKQHNPFLI
jgi:glyoxylase-like metal-dependent hydrolase (beta-lactamase superfamily II)